MSTQDYFLYFPMQTDEHLKCKLCGSVVQFVEVHYDDLHYRCSNEKCARHIAGETTDIDEYPTSWVAVVN